MKDAKEWEKFTLDRVISGAEFIRMIQADAIEAAAKVVDECLDCPHWLADAIRELKP